MPINSWSIESRIYKDVITRYIINNEKHTVTVDRAILAFHGAKNTKYQLLFSSLEGADFSFGIPTDYSYFFGANSYIPDAMTYGYQLISTYFNVRSEDKIGDNYNSFSKKPIEITTDQNGNYDILVTDCNVSGHYVKFNVNIWMQNYSEHKLVFSYCLPNTNGSDHGYLD